MSNGLTSPIKCTRIAQIMNCTPLLVALSTSKASNLTWKMRLTTLLSICYQNRKRLWRRFGKICSQHKRLRCSWKLSRTGRQPPSLKLSSSQLMQKAMFLCRLTGKVWIKVIAYESGLASRLRQRKGSLFPAIWRINKVGDFGTTLARKTESICGMS